MHEEVAFGGDHYLHPGTAVKFVPASKDVCDGYDDASHGGVLSQGADGWGSTVVSVNLPAENSPYALCIREAGASSFAFQAHVLAHVYYQPSPPPMPPAAPPLSALSAFGLLVTDGLSALAGLLLPWWPFPLLHILSACALLLALLRHVCSRCAEQQRKYTHLIEEHRSAEAEVEGVKRGGRDTAASWASRGASRITGGGGGGGGGGGEAGGGRDGGGEDGGDRDDSGGSKAAGGTAGCSCMCAPPPSSLAGCNQTSDASTSACIYFANHSSPSPGSSSGSPTTAGKRLVARASGAAAASVGRAVGFLSKRAGGARRSAGSADRQGAASTVQPAGWDYVATPAWDSTPMRSRPAALHAGLRPTTREPWAADEETYYSQVYLREGHI